MNFQRLQAAAQALVRRAQAACRMGSPFSPAEVGLVRAKLGDAYPHWLLALQMELPLAGLEIGYESRHLPGHTLWMKWSDAESMVKEALELVPGKAILDSGYVPVASCLDGSEDPYFIQVSKEAPLWQISHDAGLEAKSILKHGTDLIADSLADFFENAILSRGGNPREPIRIAPRPVPSSVRKPPEPVAEIEAASQAEEPAEEPPVAGPNFAQCQNPACQLPLVAGFRSARFAGCGELGDAAAQLCSECLDLYAGEPGLGELLAAWKLVRLDLTNLLGERGVQVLLGLHRAQGARLAAAMDADLWNLAAAGLIEAASPRSGAEGRAAEVRLSPRGGTLLRSWFAGGEQG